MTQIAQLFMLILTAAMLSSCALLGMMMGDNVEAEKADRFEKATGHELLKMPIKEEKGGTPPLGYIFENGVFVKKVWGGRIEHSATGQNITLRYKKEDADKIKVFLGSDFSFGPELQNVNHFVLTLEDIHQYQLVDAQPLIEFMGKDSLPLLEQDFIISMIKVSKFSVQAFQKISAEFGAEYHPYPMVNLKGSTGTSAQRDDDQFGYNIFVGYKTYNGSHWLQDFESKPKINVAITHPADDATIPYAQTRVKGGISDYRMLTDEYRNRLRVYVITRNEFEDEWVLQPEARVGTDGKFESVVDLGTLRSGNGQRYSIAVFATYFAINKEANSKIPFLPFDKGRYLINVKREDRIP